MNVDWLLNQLGNLFSAIHLHRSVGVSRVGQSMGSGEVFERARRCVVFPTRDKEGTGEPHTDRL